MVKQTGKSSILKVIVATSVFLLAVILAKRFVIEGVFFYLFNGQPVYKYFQAVFLIFFQLSVYYYVFKTIERREVTELAFKKSFKRLITGFALGVFAISLSIFILNLLNILNLQSTAAPVLMTIVKSLLFFSLLALFEELMFRGIIQNNIQKIFGSNIAIFASAIVFALAHISNTDSSLISFMAVFIGGAILGVLYSITNTIWLPYAFHIGWNFMQGILGLTVSGVAGINSLYTAKLSGNRLLTGGNFGIEASIVTIVLTGLLFIVLFKYKTSRLKE